MSEPEDKQTESLKKFTFTDAMASQLLMLLLALMAIFYQDKTVDYFGHLTIIESIIYGILGAIVIYAILGAAYLLPSDFMTDLRNRLSSMKQSLDNMAFWQLVVIGMSAGIVEELLFREVIQGWLTIQVGVNWGIILASIIFGLVHFISVPYVIVTTIMGLVLGLLFHSTQSLVLVMIMHGVYDMIAFFVIRYRPHWLRLNSSAP